MLLRSYIILNTIPKNTFIIFFIILFFISIDTAIAEDWMLEQIDKELVKNDPDIKILSRKKGEYKEYLGEVTIEGSLESVSGLIRDVENFKWIKNTKSFDVEELNFFESCVCHEFKSFGFRRKILYVARQERGLCNSPIIIHFGESSEGKCDVNSKELNNCSEIKKKHKVNEFSGFYKLIPLEKDKTKVIIRQYSDPKFGDDFFGRMKKKKFPDAAAEALFETLSGFKKEFSLTNKYSNRSFKCDEDGFITGEIIN